MPRVLPLLVLASTFLHADEIHLADVKLADLNLAGSAQMEGESLRLTGSAPHLAGAAWLTERQPIGNGFQTQFQFQLTEQGGTGGGADGFAFVLQNSGPSALGGSGSGGGFALGDDTRGGAIPQSVAVFFDTFRNEDIGDPSNNFVTICTAGTPKQLHWPPARLGSSKKLRVNLKDRKKHTARIEYLPPALTVYLDGKRVLATAVDLSTVTGSDGTAWAGFTASTGDGYENHDILNWSFAAAGSKVSSNISYVKSACLPDRNLCTPEQASVEETGPGSFHVVLPGNLEWGASVPNPGGGAVTILNARGSVCRDVATRGAEGCAGPGALIQRTAGARTSFWISLSGDARENEGYFEFDARIDGTLTK
jgi:hypothetical protein